RNFLGQSGVREVFDLGQRQRLGSDRKREDRGVGGIDLAIDRRIGKTLRQQVGSAVNGRLHFLLGDIDVEIEIELQGNNRAAIGTGGGHLVQPGNLAELA